MCACIVVCVLFLILLIIIATSQDITEFYIQELYIPSLNNPHSYNATNLNTSIIIDLEIKRVVIDPPILYQDLNITLYYASDRSAGAVGRAVVPGFRHGPERTAHRRAVADAGALPWEEAFGRISGGSTLALTVELATRYTEVRDTGYYTEVFTAAVVAADLKVDASGNKVSKNPIRLH